MGSEGAALLLEFLRDEARYAAIRKRLFYALFGGGMGLVTLLALFLVVTHKTAALPGLSGFAGMAGLIGLAVPSQRYHQLVNALSQLDDVRAVGPLAEALSLQDMTSRMAAARALARLLPKLNLGDGDLLSYGQRAALQKVLNTGAPEKESELMLVLIDALTRVEDVSALTTMQTLSKRISQTTAERTVTEAAAEAVTLLTEAKHRLETPQTLLRASAESTAPAQLLRAAENRGVDIPAEQLLRAGSSVRED